MLGWTRPLGPEERAFVPARYAELPTLGRLTGRGNTANVEVVLAARPDLIFDYGSLTETYRSLADRVQQQTGVPYLLFDGSLSAIPDVYARVGDLLGVGDRGRELAGTRRACSPRPTSAWRACPPRSGPACITREARRGSRLRRAAPSPWRASSGWARATWPRGSAAGWPPSPRSRCWPGIPRSSSRSIRPSSASVRADPVWKSVRAVREGRVYLVPQAPFPWMDFPPSVNRLIGLKWLGRVLYPAQFPEDLRQETRAFYALFYHQAPTEAQLDALLAGLERPRP